MMLDPQILNLVVLLLSRPNSKKLPWSHTFDPEVLRLILDEGLLRIERSPETTSDAGIPATYSYGITVLDKQGGQVLGGSQLYRREEFPQLANLYEQVSNHLNEAIVGKIMDELHSKLSKMPA